jgi:hypothetical protein
MRRHDLSEVMSSRLGVRSAQADGGDGLVVVPFGPRELAAVWVCALLPSVAVLEKGGQPGLIEAGNGVPVVEAEAPRGLGRSVGGQDDPLKRRHGQGEDDPIGRVPLPERRLPPAHSRRRERTASQPSQNAKAGAVPSQTRKIMDS